MKVIPPEDLCLNNKKYNDKKWLIKYETEYIIDLRTMG